MRMPAVLDPDQFSPAERSVLRLDGDCTPLGLSDVPVDVPPAPAVRAASLARATGRADLVVETWTAAWVHGVVADLPRPLTLAVDTAGVRRRIAGARPPREARFRPDDLLRLGGVRVTTPLKTAFDLVRLEDDLDGAADVAVALLRLADVSPAVAAALAQLQPRCPNKPRAIARLAALGGRARQPADTR